MWSENKKAKEAGVPDQACKLVIDQIMKEFEWVGRAPPLAEKFDPAIIEKLAPQVIETGGETHELVMMHKFTLCYAAAMYGAAHCLKALMDAGVPYWTEDERGDTPVVAAVCGYAHDRKGMLDMLLLKARQDGRALNLDWALCAAVRQFEEACVQELLKNGANPRVVDRDDGSVLHVVLYEDQDQGLVEGPMLSLLLSAGADPEMFNEHGQTALISAVAKRRLGSVVVLIESGADLEGKDPDGATALMYAARVGDKACVELLLSKGADALATNMKGMSALDYARKRNSEACSGMLTAAVEQVKLAKAVEQVEAPGKIRRCSL